MGALHLTRSSGIRTNGKYICIHSWACLFPKRWNRDLASYSSDQISKGGHYQQFVWKENSILSGKINQLNTFKLLSDYPYITLEFFARLFRKTSTHKCGISSIKIKFSCYLEVLRSNLAWGNTEYISI